MEHLQYWRLMLSIAVTCFITNKKQQLFFPEKEEKEKKEEKKDMQVQSNEAAVVKVFEKKILPAAERRCGDFFSKPAGLDLYCW